VITLAAGIARDTIIAEVLETVPGAADILLDRGMPCVGCEVAAIGTIEEGATIHDVDPDELVSELNAQLKAAPDEETN